MGCLQHENGELVSNSHYVLSGRTCNLLWHKYKKIGDCVVTLLNLRKCDSKSVRLISGVIKYFISSINKVII